MVGCVLFCSFCIYVCLRFIDYCTEEGGCTGFKRISVEGTEEVVARLMALSIHAVSEGQYCTADVKAIESVSTLPLCL